MVRTLLSLSATIAFLALPVVMGWGWLRWIRRKEPRKLVPSLSMVGLSLATASELLAISMVLYARISGGFGFYDPALMRVYALGMLLSLLGFGFAAIGVWRPSSLRWHAMVCTVATLLYWLVQAASE